MSGNAGCEVDWLRESSWRRDKKAAASLQPELRPVWERIYLFYLIIITIKLVGIFCHNKKNICSSFFDGTCVCFLFSADNTVSCSKE
jgi:hypothetical protein